MKSEFGVGIGILVGGLIAIAILWAIDSCQQKHPMQSSREVSK